MTGVRHEPSFRVKNLSLERLGRVEGSLLARRAARISLLLLCLVFLTFLATGASSQGKEWVVQGRILSLSPGELILKGDDRLRYRIALSPSIRLLWNGGRGLVPLTLPYLFPGDRARVTVKGGKGVRLVASFFLKGGRVAYLQQGRIILEDFTQWVLSQDAVVEGATGEAGEALLSPGNWVVARGDPDTLQISYLFPFKSPPRQGEASLLHGRQVSISPSRPVRGGERIQIRINAGGSAEVSLGGVASSLPLRRTGGGWLASSLIPPGIYLEKVPAVLSLSSGGETKLEVAASFSIYSRGPGVRSLFPPDGGSVTVPSPYIGCLFSPTDPLCVPSSLAIFLDGRRVWKGLHVSPSFVLFSPEDTPDSGRHRVSVRGSDRAGNPVQAEWSFLMVGQGNSLPENE